MCHQPFGKAMHFCYTLLITFSISSAAPATSSAVADQPPSADLQQFPQFLGTSETPDEPATLQLINDDIQFTDHEGTPDCPHSGWTLIGRYCFKMFPLIEDLQGSNSTCTEIGTELAKAELLKGVSGLDAVIFRKKCWAISQDDPDVCFQVEVEFPGRLPTITEVNCKDSPKKSSICQRPAVIVPVPTKSSSSSTTVESEEETTTTQQEPTTTTEEESTSTETTETTETTEESTETTEASG